MDSTLLDFALDAMTAPLPGTLWIELTSKCPFDCIFCSRRLRRGEGRHLDFGVCKTLISELEAPDQIRLNYSGESIHYPQLIDVIALAGDKGATELVTAFASISPSLLESLVRSRLGRLTVSLHTMDPDQYRELYRFGSLELLRRRMLEFAALKLHSVKSTPELDFAFVAMYRNLDQLAPVVGFAEYMGASRVSVHPVIGRGPTPVTFSRERISGRLSDSFKAELRAVVRAARQRFPGMEIQVADPDTEPALPLGYAPAPYPSMLPDGARIRTCEQNPWDTVHLLANGDVVPCEVMDGTPLGNLAEQSLREIWMGERFRIFRRNYARGEIAACRACPWKVAYLPSALQPYIAAEGKASIQLLRGWQEQDNDGLFWSRSEAALILKNRPAANGLLLMGILPPASDGDEIVLEVCCNAAVLGTVCNSGPEALLFKTCLRLPAAGAPALDIRIKTGIASGYQHAMASRDMYAPGFGLIRVESVIL